MISAAFSCISISWHTSIHLGVTIKVTPAILSGCAFVAVSHACPSKITCTTHGIIAI